MELNLLERARQGDRRACADIIQAHYERVFRFLAQLTQNSEKAADLTQEVFNTAWQKIGSFREESSLNTWLNRIAYFKYVDAGRAETRRNRAHQDLHQRWQQPDSVSPLLTAIENENSKRLYYAVQQLADDQREVIVLHYFQGLSLSETAAVLSKPLGTIKWKNSQALEALRRVLSQRDENDD